MKTITILLFTKGDPSVGIPSQETELDTKIDISDYDPDINKILDSFADNFGELWDEQGYWEFAEETAKELENKQTITKDTIITKKIIENLKAGDIVCNAFGQMVPVTKVYARGVDKKGKNFVCYYAKFGENARMSNRLVEGTIIVTL